METIQQQWNNMLDNNIIPCFEFKIKDDEWLLVNLEYNHSGILFSFDDDNKPVYFDGEIESFGYKHLLPFDEYVDSLDCMLEMINDNIVEGYILPNNLDDRG